MTAELDESLLDELIALKDKRDSKLSFLRKVRAEKNAVRRINRDRLTVARIRSEQLWLNTAEDIPLELCTEFIRRSAWWHTHSSGRPVRAPNHSRRVYKSRHGWAIDFGANSFLISKAVSRSRKEIDSALERLEAGDDRPLFGLKEKIKRHISGAVANHNNDEYDGYYSLAGDDMMFGAQSIDVEDGASFLIRVAGINDLLKKVISQ